MKRYRSGEQAPKTGSYISYDKDGNNGGSVSLEKGQRFPATQNEGSFYVQSEKQKRPPTMVDFSF